MLKTIEGISETKKRLTIEIPAEVIESNIKMSLLEVQRKSVIPGFRPGKTPLSIIEKKFGKSVEADVMDKLIPEYYQKAIKEANLKPISPPVIEDATDFERNKSLSMTFAVEVMPQLDNISYEGIKVDEVPIEVTDLEIDNTLKSLAEEKATFESVDDQIFMGDLITVDYKTDIDEPPKKDVVLKVGSGPYPQEFHEALVNRKKDETFEFQATFPEELQSSPYVGKTVKFDMTITDIKRRNVPAIDDELAVDLGFENLQMLKEKARESLLLAKTNKANNIKFAQIIDKLIDTYNFEIPQSMLNAKINDFISEIRALRNDDRPEEEIRQEVLPLAERAVRTYIITEIIAEKENIKVTEEDMKAKVMEIAQNNRISPDNVIKYYLARDKSLNALQYAVYEQKVKDLLLSKAEVIKGE